MATMQTTQTPFSSTTALGVPDRGVDRPEDRPGVPMETAPRPVGGAHWTTPERQVPTVPVLKRMEIDALTPAFGTAQPPKGLSGAIRRLAYNVPQHKARRWMMLLMADRVDMIENRIASAPKWLAVALPIVAIGIGIGLARGRKRTFWQRVFA